MIWLIFGVFALLSFIVGNTLKSKFRKYSNVVLPMTGAEYAELMLRDHGITNVKVRPTSGNLTDFYNPGDLTINLSEEVYASRTLAAAAVAAHETGHAVQHAVGYKAMSLRTALVPIQNLSSTVINIVFIAMFALSFFSSEFLNVGIGVIVACYAVFTLFSFVTLGVEIDASQRAIRWLTDKGYVDKDTRESAVDALKWAAYTYLVSALSSLAMLVYYIIRMRD